MIRAIIVLSLMCAACGQPESARTVAAYEVPLPSALDKQRFLAVLTQKAEAFGFHVYSAPINELKATSQTFSSGVWRGKDDDQLIASAMDFEDRIGRVWITFSLGENPARSRKFRDALMPAVKNDWPDTASLPIMPTGALPLSHDLVRTTSGYTINPSSAAKYDAAIR
jgi:hypothetical protein